MRNTLIASLISLVAVVGVICCLVFTGGSGATPDDFDPSSYDPPSATSDAPEKRNDGMPSGRIAAEKEPSRTGLVLSGTVVNADRRGVVEAEVEIQPVDASSEIALATARTDARGRYSLTFDGSSAGLYRVAVRHADYLPAIKRWSGASQGAVDIELSSRPATVSAAAPKRRVRVYEPPPKREPEPAEVVRKRGRDRSDRRGDRSGRREEKVKQFDLDGDGELSEEERQSAREQRGGGRRGGGRAGGARGAGRGRGGDGRGRGGDRGRR